MTYPARSIVAVVVIMITAAGGAFAQESPYNRDIRDLKATILDLKGLPSNLNSAVSDLSARADRLAAQHGGLTVRQDIAAVRVSMMGDILFDFDKADIRRTAEPTLTDGADNPDGRALNRRVEFVLPRP